MKEEKENGDVAARKVNDGRRNEYRTVRGMGGLVMSNANLPSDHPMAGDFTVAAMSSSEREISHWEGWPLGRWWNSPLLFWDAFSKSGAMGSAPDPHDNVGVVCLHRMIQPGKSQDFEFLLGWRFPNRTPERCGWSAPPGLEKSIIGNHYAEMFKSSWDAVQYAADHLQQLEGQMRAFTETMRASTIPSVVKEAASANLSTLATTTCFRTADGEFHGFEGSDDTRGCCHGNCTHVWNYETVTPFLFPSFARSLRRSSFGFSMDEEGAMHFRQNLPDGKSRWGFAAADGQMGQIIHAWIDWRISGDDALLRSTWPGVKKAIEFAWVPGGWDANRDGVMEGVQHNTYDVEFMAQTRCAVSTTWVACAQPKRWHAQRVTLGQRTGIESSLSKAAAGSTRICSMASSMSRKYKDFEKIRSRAIYGVRWGPKTPCIRSIKSGRDAWSISSSDNT